MESVKKAKHRLRQFPKLLFECRELGHVYAACVTSKRNDIKKDECKKEFDRFKACLAEAAAKHNTRL